MKNKIYCNQIGYRMDGYKTAVFTGEAEDFSLVDSINHESVFTGFIPESRKIEAWGERASLLDFSACTLCGTFYLRVRGGAVRSDEFFIAESPYQKLLTSMSDVFFFNRCGFDTHRPGDHYADFGHSPCHMDPLPLYVGKQKLNSSKHITDSVGNTDDSRLIDASGGFHDDSEYGKSVYQQAVAIAELVYAIFIRNHRKVTFYGSDSTKLSEYDPTDSIINEIKYGLLWLLKMQDSDGSVFAGVKATAETDIVPPDQDKTPYTVSPKTANSAAAFAAVCALSYWMFRSSDPIFAKTLSDAAISAWLWYAENEPAVRLYPGLRFWAVCELYALTGAPDFLAEAKQNVPDDITHIHLYNVSGLGMLSIFSHPGHSDLELRRQVMFALRVNADNLTSESYKSIITRTDFPKCSNIYIMSDAIALATAGAVLKSKDYTNAAHRNFDYILGANPLGKCFVTGFGTNPVRHPHHTLSASHPESEPIPGMAVYGATADRLADTYLKWQLPKGTPPAKCYGDAPSSRSANSASRSACALLYLLASAM
jgi:endoglucanase